MNSRERGGRLRTRPVGGRHDVADHFDRLAPAYREAHGHAGELLAYRVGILRRLLASAGGAGRGSLLEIGCGPGVHLLAMAGGFERAAGVDISPEMIRVARRRSPGSPSAARVAWRVDAAEELATVEDRSVDVALCVGALEHVVDQAAALRQVRRVLVPGGAFVCLTPNGGWWWYRVLAPLLARDVRHLSTDRFLTARQLRALAVGAGLRVTALGHWRFVPRGDLPVGLGPVLAAADSVGERLGVGWLRGGLALAAVSP
ncbi:MAG: methyltransferase domain-containing protein [Acidimicrobiia bacterium]|nr:methyltransferase domain-containing protein [Acidimicrobiia bacterium]